VAHGRLLLAGLEELHGRPELGWLLLASCWLSGLFGMTFLLRLAGDMVPSSPGQHRRGSPFHLAGWPHILCHFPK